MCGNRVNLDNMTHPSLNSHKSGRSFARIRQMLEWPDFQFDSAIEKLAESSIRKRLTSGGHKAEPGDDW
jgi:hypothetical protein